MSLRKFHFTSYIRLSGGFQAAKKKGTQLRSLLFIDPIHHVILVLIMALISCSGSDCSVF